MTDAATTAAIRWRARAMRAEKKLAEVKAILTPRPDVLILAAKQNDDARKALGVKEER